MKTKVLIVEDEFSIALDLRQRLEDMDYDVVDWAESYEEALVKIVEHSPDIVLTDIQLNKEKDGIETAKQIVKSFKLPIVFVTAFSDKITFEKAMEASPMGYVTKPFKDEDLKNNIELALQKHRQLNNSEKLATSISEFDEKDVQKEYIFLKSKNQYEKVYFTEIVFLEALDNYTNIYTDQKKYTINYYLRDFYAQLPSDKFVRIHRSFAVALDAIKAIEDNLLLLRNNTSIPVSKSYKKEFLEKIKMYS